jgi:hypothetical protein
MRNSPVAQCKYHEYCGRDVEDNTADGFCILHSTDSAKDAHTFAEALAAHRELNGDNFTRFVFPGKPDFTGTIFAKEAGFFQTTFGEGADFTRATFREGADFGGATFSKEANFREATLSEKADFCEATFSGKTLFVGQPRSARAGRIFAGTKVDFRQVVINPSDAVTFLGADLTWCQFQDTDLRKVQLLGVTWPQKGRRTVVYDEITPVELNGGRWALQLSIWVLIVIPVLLIGIVNLDGYFGYSAGQPWSLWLDGVMGWEIWILGVAIWIVVVRRVGGWIDRKLYDKALSWSQIERLYRELKQNTEL